MTPPSSRATWTTAPRNSGSTVPDEATAESLESLSDTERTELAIKFGRIRMCAALTHGHSFESSVFKLPGKCSACHEMVWGPFTRGSTCLTCKLTAHRSCTGTKTMPPCPTKVLFDDFCRSELAKRRPEDAIRCSSENHPRKMSMSTPKRPAELDEWATVEGGSNVTDFGLANQGAALPSPSLSPSRSPSPVSSPELVKSSTPPKRVHNPGSSFTWSPFGILGDRKRLQSPTSEPQPEDHSRARSTPSVKGQNERSGCGNASASADKVPSPSENSRGEDSRDSPSSGGATSGGVSGLGSFGRISVAGGVVGAVLGGPAGAVAGLKLGVFVAAGRWTVQEKLWQRIKQQRKEAGADAIGLGGKENSRTFAGDATRGDGLAGSETSDIWALIAQRIETNEKQHLEWELDSTQKEHLQQEDDAEAEEIASSVVEKMLGDETAVPCRLLQALLSEFNARHRAFEPTDERPPCGCTRAKPRRRRDDDMVSVFPGAGDTPQSAPPALNEISENDVAYKTGIPPDGDEYLSEGRGVSEQTTTGLEKTFSFVEETEIVAGEGSDGPAANEDEIGLDEEEDADADEEGDELMSTCAKHNGKVEPSSALIPISAEISTIAAGARRLVPGTAAQSEASKTNATHLDSWVELEGIGCNSCGGRVVRGQSTTGRNSDVAPEDMEEDEGGFGDSWAAAEAPPCGCVDEPGISASLESMQSTVHGSIDEGNLGRGDGKQHTGELGNERGQGDGERERDATREVKHSGVTRSASETGSGSSQVPEIENEPSCAAEGEVDRNHSRDRGCEERKQTDPGNKRPEGCDALRDVHGVLREVTRTVFARCPALTFSDAATIHAVNCIDRHVLADTYRAVFGRVASGQARERDAALIRRVRQDQSARAAGARPSLASSCQPRAMNALSAARRARTGLDKLGFLLRAVEEISESLPPRSTTDTLLWSLCRHLAAAATTGSAGADGKVTDKRTTYTAFSRPHAEVAFVEQFMRDESWLMGKEGYALTTIDAALHVLLSPTLSDEVFLDVNPEQEQAPGPPRT